MGKEADMNALRFLVIHRDPEHADRICFQLAGANHTVLAAPNLAEGAEALLIQRFDAALLDATWPPAEVAEFTAILRQVEQNQGLKRIPVVSVWPQGAPFTPSETESLAWDTRLEEPLDPVALTEAVTHLAQAVGRPGKSGPETSPANEHPVLEPEEFEEQVGGDHELMVEIINLFLEESTHQRAEMRRSLASGNYVQLSRLAHTIKGSLASLRATRARWRAQELEFAAGDQNGSLCHESLSALEQDLTALEPELLFLRQRVLA